MSDSTFLPEVRLLLRVLPLVAEEQEFALKGGTAINMFLRNMPRLSVDIDLTYLPIAPREQTLKNIASALGRIRKRIKATIPSVVVKEVVPKGVGSASGLAIRTPEAQIKVEVNLVIRGSVFDPTEMDLCKRAQKEFSAELQMKVLSKADVYGGKLCAALDRQHPRDLFDVKLLLDENGLTKDVQRAFVVYLASHDRPMSELLAPTWKDIGRLFEDDFRAMTTVEVTLSSLLAVRNSMLSKLKKGLSVEEKEFLLSIKRGDPKWTLLDIPHLEQLPALRWKLLNVKKMDQKKHREAILKLEIILSQ